MPRINFLIIFFLFLFVLIDGIGEDLFDDLWKNLKPSTSKNFKKQKHGEINAIKEEIDDYNENAKQQNAKQIEMEDIKPKELQKIEKESFDEINNILLTKVKEPKIEIDKSCEESFENPSEQDDQNVLSANQSNSDGNEDYNHTESEEINEMDILNKFNLMKKKLRNKNVYKNLTFLQFECEIAKKLGTNRNKIFKLKKKLGQKRERTEENEETKRQLIKKFNQIRIEKICGLKCDEKKRSLIEREIANELGISRDKIYKWKKEFGVIKKFSTEKKIKKIKQFEKVKKEFQKKFNLKPNWKIDKKIAQKIGLLWERIYKWKIKFGLKTTRKIKTYSDAEKLEYVKRSEELRKRNPMISERKIADKLDIPIANLWRWTKKFGTKLIQ